MKKIYTLLILFFFINFSFAQNFNMSNSTVNVNCVTGGTLYDSGGPSGNYGNNQTITMTICPSDPTQGIKLDWVSLGILGLDELCAYDGIGVTNPLIGCYDQSSSISTAIRTTNNNTDNGCITLQFVSDGTITGNFELDITCAPPCQTVDYFIDSISPTLDSNNYSFVTLGSPFTICATGLYPSNNANYPQSDLTSNFYWNLGDGQVDTGRCVTYTYPDVGIYEIQLIIEDINGCNNLVPEGGVKADSIGTGSNNPIKVVVLPIPEAEYTPTTTICLGTNTTISGSLVGAQLPNGFIEGDTLNASGSSSVVNTQYAGDNNGAFNCDGIYTPLIYDLPITGYQPGATITNINQIISICTEIEHSFLGDLDIIIQCPNGQQSYLMDNNCGNSGNLGEPIDVEDSTQIGVPYQYCWSPTTTNPTMIAAPLVAGTLPAGTYASQSPWSDLIGCPLNGNWQLLIGDDYGIDDGFVFSASIELDPLLLVDADTIPLSYDPVGSWTPDSNTISNNGNDMVVNFSTPGTYTYTYTVTDNYDNTYDLTTDFVVEGFDIIATPEDTTICDGESVQLNAAVDGVNITCAPDYFQYEIPYYKEIGSIIPFNFPNYDNSASASIPLPFPFKFFCTNPTTFRAYVDGYIGINGASGFSVPNNSAIPSTNQPNNLIALMWDDLVDSSKLSGYFVTGTTPDRRLVVDYELIHKDGTSNTEPVVGQIILHETTNIIDIICENCQQDVSDPTASQGIENFTASSGVATPGRSNAAWSATQNAIRFYPKSSLNTNYTIAWTPSTGLIGDSTQAPLASPLVSTEYVVEITNNNGCTYYDTVNINVGGDFTRTISNDTTICLGESVQLEVTGGAQTFAWTPNDGSISDTSIANPIFTPTATTTYTVALDSTNTCTAYESVTIQVAVLSVDSTLTTNETCFGDANGSIEIFSSNSATTTNYSIDGGTTFVTSNLFTNLSPNVYNVMVSGAANCDTAYQVEIFGNPAVIIDSIIGTNPSCGNTNDGAIIIYAQGGTGTLNYSIDNGVTFQTGNNFPNLLGGAYNIIVQDSLTCAVDSNFVLNQPDPILIQVDQNDSLSCFNDTNGVIEISATGGVGTLVYSNDGVTFGTTTTYTGLNAGTYTVYVQDNNMCIDSLDVIVHQPDSLFITNIVVDSTNCFGSDIGSLISFDGQGGSTPYTYAIDAATFGATNTFNDLAVGNYQLVVNDDNGCLSNQVDTNIAAPLLLEFILDPTINATCGLNNGAIYVNGLGGSSPYTFNIVGAPVQNNGNFINLAAGNYDVLITDANGCDTMQNITLNGFPASEITLVNVDSVSCFGLNDGLIEVQANNGTAPFEFSIDNGVNYQFSGLFNNLAANTYSIILRDSVGCLDTLTQIVNQPTEIVLTATIDSVSCFGLTDGEVVLNATGGNLAYQFSITNDADLQNNNTYTNIAASTFTAYVVDAKNCRDSISITVTQPDTLIITNTIVTDISCFGDANGSIQINVSGGTQAYTYSIDNVNFQNNNTLTNLSGGTYTVYVLDANNCSANAIDSVFEPADLTLSIANSKNVTCNNGNNGSIEVNAGGGEAPYQYSVDGINFQNNAIFNNLTANNYIITVRDNNNCTETVTQILTQPNALGVIIDSTNILCFGDTNGSITITSIFGETAPYSVVFDGGVTQNYTQGMTFSNLSAGTYNLSISDANGCPLNGYSQDVIIEAPNLFEIANVVTVDPLCFDNDNGSIAVTTNGGGVAPYEFHISDGTNTSTNSNGEFDNLSEGVYAIWVTDQNGCTSETTDTLYAPDELILNIDSVLDASCFAYEDGFIQVSAMGGTPASNGTPYVFTLNGETVSTTGLFSELSENLYSISVTDENNCVTTLQVQVLDPEPVIAKIIPQDALIEMGDTLTLAVILTNAEGSDFRYVWSPNDGLSCTDCSNPIVNIYNNEEFNLTFYDENGCFTTTSTYIEVSDTLRYFIPNAFTPGGFDETNNLFEVYGQDIKFVDMMIFNRWGEKIYETANALQGWDGTYQNVLQNPGVYTYFIKITFLNDDTVEKKGSVTLLR